jgi:hypothetical protein
MDASTQLERCIMRIQIYVPSWIEMKRAAIQRLAKCKEENLCVACLKPIEVGKKVVRGCHEYCHTVTLEAVKAGTYTEAERIASGKLLTKETGGRKPSNPVAIEARLGAAS